MVSKGRVEHKPVSIKPFVVRRLAKSGGSRYLAVGTIVPLDWINVKITIERMSNDGCVLTIVPIR